MEFKEPPAERRRQRSDHWENAVAELRKNPGKWGMVGVYSPGVASHLRKGKYPSFIPNGTDNPEKYMSDHWEVTTRRINDGRRNEVFIRWIGDGTP
jgi:hypothetical protein